MAESLAAIGDIVRRRPPDEATSPWFLKLLSAPPAFEPGAPSKKLRRVETSIGHFAICSFDFLELAKSQPLDRVHGVRIARPEVIALVYLLHRPEITDTLIAGTDYRRSNKDLGRVLALAYLMVQRDRRDDTKEFDAWAGRMWSALQDKFGGLAAQLTAQAGAGLRAVLESPAELDQALRIANFGLLASLDMSVEAFRATGARVLANVIEELEAMAR